MCTTERLPDWETMRLLSAENMQLFPTPLFVILSVCYKSNKKTKKHYCVSIHPFHGVVLKYFFLYIFSCPIVIFNLFCKFSAFLLNLLLSELCTCICVSTDLYTRCSLGPHRLCFVFRRSYKHDRQRLPGGHEVILDLCVVGGYT